MGPILTWTIGMLEKKVLKIADCISIQYIDPQHLKSLQYVQN